MVSNNIKADYMYNDYNIVNIEQTEKIRDVLYELVPNNQKELIDKLKLNYSIFESSGKEKLMSLLNQFDESQQNISSNNTYNFLQNNNNINLAESDDISNNLNNIRHFQSDNNINLTHNEDGINRNGNIENIDLTTNVNRRRKNYNLNLTSKNNLPNSRVKRKRLNLNVIDLTRNYDNTHRAQRNRIRDSPKKIISQKVECLKRISYLVEWKPRSNGTVPSNSYISSTNLKRRHNRILMDYLENDKNY